MRKATVIRSLKEVIEAQNTLIEWLLRRAQVRRQKRMFRSQTHLEVKDGHD
jgi:hypothetical protein